MAPLTLALAGARLRAARGRQAAIIAVLALAAVIPIVAGASAALTANAALARALDQLAPGNRSVIVSYGGLLDAAQSARTDATVRDRLSRLGAAPVRRQLEYRQLADSAGATFTLAAADDLARAVRVVQGRLPRSCTPARCEVVAEVPPGVRAPLLREGYGLAVVGRVVRTDPLLLSGTFDPGTQVPLVLADGVQRAASIEPLALIQRSYGWVAPLEATVVSRSGVPAWSRAAVAVADQLSADLAGLQLVTPDAALRAQDNRATQSAQRFGLLAGSCAVLLLGAAAAGGAAMRPDHVRFAGALRRRGLSAGRLRLVVAQETGVLALAGTLLGLAAGFSAAAAMAAHAGLPVLAIAKTAVGQALPEILGLTAGAWALLVLSLWPVTGRPAYLDQRQAWRVVLAAAGAGLVAVLLVISRGSAGAGGAASAASDPLVVTLPAVVLLTLGLFTARVWPWAVRRAFGLLPRRAPGLRLGIAGISGRPMLAAATVALLAAGVGATGFAASYRSTLLSGAADQAAFAVPFDARIVPGAGLTPVLTVASVAQFAAVAPGTCATAVWRQAGSIRTGTRDAEVIQLVGIDPAVLTRVQRWSRVTGGADPEHVAQSLRVPPPPLGVRLPPGRQLTVALREGLPPIELRAFLRTLDGTERTVPLQRDSTASTLTADLPAVPAGNDAWYLATITVQQSQEDATRREHGLGEGTTARDLPSGRISFGAISVDGAVLERPWAPWSGAGLAVDQGGAGAVLDYELATSVLPLRAAGLPRQPLPVAADPRTAAQGPLVTVLLNGAAVRVRVVVTLPRMPTVAGRFVVADRAALTAAAEAVQPGQGQPGEIWLDLPGPAEPTPGEQEAAAAALRAAPFTGTDVQWAADLERSLRSDPVARGAVQLLVLAAALTMLVALAALVLLVASERFEDAGELYSWEADGVSPAALRRGLWVRAALVAVVAVPAGVLGGLVLTRLTARLVGLTAGAQQPQPPLDGQTGAGTALAVVVLALTAALLAAALVAARAFRESSPVPPGLSGGAR